MLPRTNGVFTPEQDNDKAKIEPVHSYDAFHSGHVGPGVKLKGKIGMHRFNICLVVVLLWCENTITLGYFPVCSSNVSRNLGQTTPVQTYKVSDPSAHSHKLVYTVLPIPPSALL